jgi:hypothetical protein
MAGWSIRGLMLGIVLFVLALVASWGQDVLAPWVNAGEADLRSTVTLESDGGDYRVITSGPTRPRLEDVACDVVGPNGETQRILGGKDVNANERFGVSRVLGFDAPEGTVEVTCADRLSESSTHGRFQVVDADGPVSLAILGLFVVGPALIVLGGLGLFLAHRRSVGRCASGARAEDSEG